MTKLFAINTRLSEDIAHYNSTIFQSYAVYTGDFIGIIFVAKYTTIIKHMKHCHCI